MGAFFGYHGTPASYDLVHSATVRSAPGAHRPVYGRFGLQLRRLRGDPRVRNDRSGSPTGGIPDPFTGKFDTIGAFAAPGQLLVHLQVAYDITPRVSLVANLANIVNECFGGSKTAFTVNGACAYQVLAGGTTGAVGNAYNPGSPVRAYASIPYSPSWTNISPFAIFVGARVKL